ncbi:MAG TPA: hypothetical protein VMV14_02505 [Acidimicrobiales bacterium]|nr:hypothetical protein [Acidimicrobiales bacterium]
MPTPVGPAPRDPNDPDFWDWGEDLPSYSANGGYDDEALVAELERRQRRRRVVALVVAALVVIAVVAASL